MTYAALTACQRSFSNHITPAGERNAARLHWTIVNSLGLSPNDVIHASPDLKVYRIVASQLGNRFSRLPQEATIVVLSRPNENELVHRANRLQGNCRLVAYNTEDDVDQMSMRSFELATACVFDPESGKVARIFDGLPRRVPSYMHVELSEHSDSSLSLQASRIASLR